MNFIAHFFLDKEHPQGLFAIGVATPDLLSIYNAELRIKKAHLKGLDSSGFSDDELFFLEGIRRHFYADGVFHSSAFFFEETGYISDLLIEFFPKTEIPRKFFIAHVLLELLMDKVIIQDNPGILELYYDHYQSTNGIRVKNITEKISGRKLPHYERFMEKFTRQQYLQEYRRWDHIAFVLRRVLQRVNIHEHDFTFTAPFVQLMQTYENRLSSLYPDIFQEIIDYNS